ncbi:MAG: response regulator [Proteobacteria bacterium]|nr:response regulator [Pseudomonadota bacterium]MBU4036889.1 response regulator [Pseudomonadota bacterium]
MAFNVLIVDDSSSMRAVIKKVIKASGFNVGNYFEAGDGIEGLKILENDWIDLVLSDINMPNMDGMLFLSEMKKNELFSSIPVVMITTEGSEAKIQEAIRLGSSGYIKKPFSPVDIKNILSRLMGEEVSDVRGNDDSDETGDF